MRACIFFLVLVLVSCSTNDHATDNFLNTVKELQLPTSTTDIENLEVTEIDTAMVRALKIFGHDRPFEVSGANIYETWFAYGKIIRSECTVLIYGYSSPSDTYIRMATFVNGERKDDIALTEAVPSVGVGISPNYASIDEELNMTIHSSVFENSLRPSAAAFISYRINAKGSIMETGRNIVEFKAEIDDEYDQDEEEWEDAPVLTQVNLPIQYTTDDLVLAGTPVEIQQKQVFIQENIKSSSYQSYVPFMMSAVQPELLEKDFDRTDDRYVFGIATLTSNSNFYTNLYFVRDDEYTAYYLASIALQSDAFFKLKLFDNNFFKGSETRQASLEVDKQLGITLELWNGSERINRKFRIEKTGNIVAVQP
ncbi:MAG: hypothetical protein KF687_00545 [Cyclobacteriaceae bacterium]|nr:hypothetical protein [Cyclobacteriaceae bacterium]